ncbi:peptidylglycine monooxygenase [Wenyingzhuangia fucanilytica]|uniref:Peptidylglycine monooxygenase n=1 Tax=Wenyingzhuangia fucanilytica TaxID=1790137 RepID=A0A1B1Y518_9FLAO|nr:6-bladed beta-propeller [Wenyingzhuangia fucanilytica]ANW95864.1 peptidylglycine monooxygenase [Wenyingzhuangia fucanilytica]
MKRRTFINTTAKAGAGIVAIPHFNILKSKPKLSDSVIGHGDFKYRIHKSWGDLDRTTTPVKNCHEMVMDSKGRLIMVGDDVHNNILIYDKSGKLLDSWGIRYKGGHGLSLWNDGSEDFLFICDTNGSLIKTTTDGRELMLIGHPSEYGAYKKEDPFKPTESAIAPNGDIYIADGYGSNYILQFTKDGEFVRKIGGGRGVGENQFQTAHGVCIDNRGSGNPTLLITSRAANCFKRFTLDGNYIETISLPGAFVCRPVIHNDNLYSGVCWSSDIKFEEGNMKTHPTRTSKQSGFVTILDKSGKVVSNPGGTKPTYKNGELQTMLQSQPIFKHCHDVCVDNDENLYVCQWNANKAYPIKLERV